MVVTEVELRTIRTDTMTAVDIRRVLESHCPKCGWVESPRENEEYPD